jgi:hypothetical protein
MSTRTQPAVTIEHRPLQRHHVVALVTSAGLSSIALFDAATKIVTGHSSVFADDSGHERLIVAGSVVHGVAYVALLFCLYREREVFADTSRLLRILRSVLMTSFVLFGGLFLVASPLLYLLTGRSSLPEDGAAGIAFGIVATVAFVGMLLGGTLTGLTQLRRPTLGVGGRILVAMAPLFAVTVLLGFLAPDWAHPGYLEAALNLGVSLVGVGATSVTRLRTNH